MVVDGRTDGGGDTSERNNNSTQAPRHSICVMQLIAPCAYAEGKVGSTSTQKALDRVSSFYLLEHLGLGRGMGGDAQLVCSEGHPIPYYRDCVELIPRQERKEERRRRLRGEDQGHQPGKLYHASFSEGQRCKTLLCRQCNRRFNVESLIIDVIVLPGNKMWTRETGKVELLSNYNPEWEIDST